MEFKIGDYVKHRSAKYEGTVSGFDRGSIVVCDSYKFIHNCYPSELIKIHEFGLDQQIPVMASTGTVSTGSTTCRTMYPRYTGYTPHLDKAINKQMELINEIIGVKDKKLEHKPLCPPKAINTGCECGRDAVGAGMHSSWCKLSYKNKEL